MNTVHVIPTQGQREVVAPVPADYDIEARPCPSLFCAEFDDGPRTIQHVSGAAGLTTMGGRTRNAADRAGFRMTMALSRFGVLDICHIRHTAMLLVRSGNQFGHPRPTVRLTIVLTGEVTLSVRGRTARIGPGGGSIVRGDDKYVYESRGDVERVHVDIALDAPAFAPVLAEAAPVMWDAQSAVLCTTGVSLREMLRHDDGGMSASDRNTLRLMAEFALLRLFTAPPRDALVAPSRQQQRAAVLSHIVTRHSDPDLTAISVAAGLGMSSRSLQRLFEQDGMTVSEHIAASRLEHALALLRDPMYTEAPLALIATRSGFGSLSRMRRAVCAATGMCPKAYRAQSVAVDMSAHVWG